jgi:acetyl-CoA acetyltransferase
MIARAYIRGAGLTSFGRHEGKTTLDLMSAAARAAMDDAGLARADIDGVICGYSTTLPHLMLSSVFCEHFGLAPHYAHSVQLGGATGLAMTALASHLVAGGVAKNILVVAGENRATGQSRDASVQALAQVGRADYEVPLGATIPAYYALVAARYMRDHGIGEADLAEFAVLMRAHAGRHSGAHLSAPITVADVLASKPIASPLKLLDCCPVSDGGAAVVVSAEPGAQAVRIRGTGQAHQHQHVSAIASFDDLGAAASAAHAFAAAGVSRGDVTHAGVYDSFTATLAILLEEIGFAGRGEACGMARAGHFSRDGALPLNTHGGLLSYGHCGVGGAMAHLVETWLQCAGRAGPRQAADPSLGFVHADGGVMSAHVSLVMERVR